MNRCSLTLWTRLHLAYGDKVRKVKAQSEDSITMVKCC